MFDDHVPAEERIYSGRRIAILVLNRDFIGRYKPAVPYIVISITDPDRPFAALAASPTKRGELRLKFHESAQKPDLPGLEGMFENTDEGLRRDDAVTLLRFVRSHIENIELIICQCEAGISRSAGVAAALSRLYNNDDAFFFENYIPNTDVYRALI